MTTSVNIIIIIIATITTAVIFHLLLHACGNKRMHACMHTYPLPSWPNEAQHGPTNKCRGQADRSACSTHPLAR